MNTFLPPPSRKVYDTDPYSVLLYWMVAREDIRLQRLAGVPAPWTPDPILKEFKFTNVFRVFDRVTQHYIRWISGKDSPAPLLWAKTSLTPPQVLFNSIYYRILNWPDTLEESGVVRDWGKERRRVREALASRFKRGEQMYTGAYMITAEHKPGIPKYLSTMETLEEAWALVTRLRGEYNRPEAWCRMSQAELVNRLRVLPRVGGFIAYEAVTDCTYSFLTEPSDKDKWANAGPGALRGINRLYGMPVKGTLMSQEDACREMVRLLTRLRKDWPRKWAGEKNRPRLGIREVEHSLCEFDKYCRVLMGEGKPRSRYNGKGDGK